MGIRTSPLSPIGRGSGLKIRAVWVRVPQRARGLGEARILTSRPFLVLRANARLAQQVEAADLESAQSGFESRGGHAGGERRRGLRGVAVGKPAYGTPISPKRSYRPLSEPQNTPSGYSV